MIYEPPAPEVLPPPTGDSMIYVHLESTAQGRSGRLWLRGPLNARLERVLLGVAWAATVPSTLYGAAAAHLPPQGALVVIVLEIVVPPVVFRSWRRRRGSRPGGTPSAT